MMEKELEKRTFKELNIEEIIDISEVYPRILEVTKIYLNPSVMGQSVRTIRRNYDYDGADISGYRLEFIGKASYTVEYLSYNVEDGVTLMSFEKVFSSNIVLPKNFLKGENVMISLNVLDVNHKKIDENRLFVNINLLVETNF